MCICMRENRLVCVYVHFMRQINTHMFMCIYMGGNRRECEYMRIVMRKINMLCMFMCIYMRENRRACVYVCIHERNKHALYLHVGKQT